ncbi:hypothetical protein [Lentzea sp. NPDC004782]|uniref:hypothetical protein n=1 Tax=Lentzea sp. NPDC004782 TaxID=3154458 RepID=UPI0033B3AC88
MAAVLISPNGLHSTRSMMRGLLLPGSRRVHFKTEKPARRELIADRLACCDFVVNIYTARGLSERARANLLPLLVEDAIGAGVTRLVLGSRDRVVPRRGRRLETAYRAGHRHRRRPGAGLESAKPRQRPSGRAPGLTSSTWRQRLWKREQHI